MEILIIENEYSYIETPFNYVNTVYFEGKLNYTVKAKYQDITPLKQLEKYDLIFLDISLAKSSSVDGIGILRKLDEEGINISNLVILTGNHDIDKKLKDSNIKNYPILTKPIDFTDLLECMKKITIP